MYSTSTIAATRRRLATWRKQGKRIALVATMGNLHQGHLQLIRRASAVADKVVVSVFVNPSQFAPGEDFVGYPRTPKQDAALCEKAGVDLLFLPSLDEIYPVGVASFVSVPALAALHCGASRPNHFDGVATVVCKLLNITQPDFAVFGTKDFQQLLVVQTMVCALHIACKIVVVQTVRHPSGLALSSRNNYLSASDRDLAASVYQTLLATEDLLRDNQPCRQCEKTQSAALSALGFRVDYFTVCRRQDLQPAHDGDKQIVVLVAAILGKCRLIDNLCFDL